MKSYFMKLSELILMTNYESEYESSAILYYLWEIVEYVSS